MNQALCNLAVQLILFEVGGSYLCVELENSLFSILNSFAIELGFSLDVLVSSLSFPPSEISQLLYQGLEQTSLSFYPF